jgi:isocitrate lyase
VLNAFELMKNMIAAGASGVHFEDQLAAVKKCGHMGGKVLVPTAEAVQKLVAARLASDVMGVPTLVLARTDAEAANLLTSDVDDNDQPFLTGERTAEGFYRVKNGLEQAISRGLAYAPYATWSGARPRRRIWGFAREFAQAVLEQNPNKLLGLQLLAVLQLEEEPGRRDHRQVPGRARGHGLQVPVHHARRFRLDGDHRRQVLDHRNGRIHGIGPVQAGRRVIPTLSPVRI